MSTEVATASRRYFSAEIAAGITTLVSVVVFSRALSPSEYGLYSLMMGVGSIALTLGVEWLQASALRRLPTIASRSHFIAHMKATGLFALAAFVVIGGICLLLHEALADRFPGRVVLAGWIFGVTSAPYFLVLTCHQARLRSSTVRMARVVYVVSKLGIACILLYFMGANWYGPALGAILAPLVVLPVVSLQVLKHLDRTEGRAELPIRQIWRFGSPLIGWYAANQILNVSDRFFIEGFLSTDQVGIYSVNYALAASLIAAVMQPLLQAAYPVLVRSSAASSGSVAPQMGKLLLLVLCVLPPVVVLLTVFGPSFVRLVSDTPYVASRWVLATLALGVSCWHVALFLQKMMEIDGATAKLFGHIAFAALLNIVANVLLIPVFGILGAAVGTLAAYLVYLFKILPNPRSLWPDNSWRFVAGRVGVALLGLSATAWLVPKILPALGGGSWIVACVCSALSYVILLRRGGLSYRIIVQDGL